MINETDNRLSLLELKCRRPVEHLLAGEFHSVFRGQGIEFEDVRPYQPGDDVRSMDWRVTARTGEPHIKRYIEEREQFLYLLVDVSASVLDSSGRHKRDTITQIASLLTMAAAKNQDRVSLILFTNEVELVIPPGKGRTHTLRIMDALLNFKPKGRETQFESVLRRFGHIAQKHSIVFIISDFLAKDYLEELCALAGRHDVNAVNVLESQTVRSPGAELVRIHDAENNESRIVDLKKVADDGSAYHESLREEMLESGISLMEIAEGEDCVEALSGFFHLRQRRVTEETRG
ncbi:MAG: DUF58 domain-containing protein [Verrucomicrobiales bacterium]|jgi:uncharacterized protein (DUF58 family)|nr:DUF58 domain-containing protein [Verrucomicrobiales bacterium]|tara:strand:- start:2827 stop:3696 length:870 start_codon:yes stop_codon:yes gene_type:complete